MFRLTSSTASRVLLRRFAGMVETRTVRSIGSHHISLSTKRSIGLSFARCFHPGVVASASFPTSFNLPDPTSPYEIIPSTRKWEPKLTKIVATIGPTSEQLPVLQEIVRNGMRIMRLNFSHATVEEVELRTSNLKRCRGRHSLLDAEEIASPNMRAVLLDTKGPEIRTGKLAHDDSGHETITLVQGNTITLDTTPERQEQGSDEKNLFIDYDKLHECLSPGMKVLLDDGAIILTVKEVESQGKVLCVVENTGELRSRAGVNLPGADTELPAMSEKDKVDIRYGMTKDVDFVAASFVQTASGVHEIRQHTQRCAQELGWSPEDPLPLIISKIETISALRNFDEILEASDGIMVARGDLGVELPLQQVTNAQKEMVAACNAMGKPVIVATQMLESMAKNPRPTRAEVSDVTNAIYDGADCVMLSGETAKGKYPVDAVKFMNEIIMSAEWYVQSGGVGGVSSKRFLGLGQHSRDAAIARAAVTATEEHQDVTAIVVLLPSTTDNSSVTESLPALVSAYRPNVPIIVFCSNAKRSKQLMVYRGIHPLVLNVTPSKNNKQHEMDFAVLHAKSMGFIETDDQVVVVTSDKDDATMKLVSVQ